MNRRRVVVENRTQALRIERNRVHHIGDVDEECFIQLAHCVAIDEHIESVSAAASGNDLSRQILCDVIATGGGRAVGGGDIKRDATCGGGR